MARIAIVGVGAIGGVTAGLLQSAGRHELLLCTRQPLSGLMVETPNGTVKVNAANAIDPSGISDVDWVLVWRSGWRGFARRALRWRFCRTEWNTVSGSPRMCQCTPLCQ